MYSSSWHLGLLARCYPSRRSGLAPVRPKSRQLIGCALVCLAAVAACEPARSQNPAPEAAPATADEVRAYLWSVYQRSPTKVDGHGDFTWKDVAAAAHAGLSVEDYVIGGMDPDFREVLFAAGHAMDAAGVEWTILSGFRDDF